MTINANLTEGAKDEAKTILVDVAIVGAGLAGSLAAAVLTRAGYRVALVDKRSVYPEEFRVEKLGGQQVDILRRLGLIDAFAKVACSFETVLNIRQGKVVDVSNGLSYGLPYAPLVAIARSQIADPPGLIVDQVLHVSPSAGLQRLSLASGNHVVARLVVLATGMSGALSHNLGIKRHILVERHSLAFGFTIAPAEDTRFAFPALTSYGERTADGIDYLSIFPVPGGMRANLFMFRDPNDPIMRELRREPKATLFRLMPGLRSHLGDFRVTDRVQSWVMDLAAVEGHLQPGIVLIGDAFQTSCPAAGTGVSRLLVDVERLCTVHLPEWLKTDGMSTEKIAMFYSDPEKIASDQRAFKMAYFRQALTSDSGFRWHLRRRFHFLRRNLRHRVDMIRPGWTARILGRHSVPRSAATGAGL
jgi:2-polyprenyl-6-methoxyphenol hydroxylase-like FAD-dependent oxidoreductase